MIALLNAIYSHFIGSLSGTFPGGLHRDAAAEGTAMPYVVSKVLSSKLEANYSSAARTTTQVQFSVFGVGHDASGALMNQLIGSFDYTLLSLSAGTNDTVIRQGDATPTLHAHDADGNDVWEWRVVYEYGVTA